MSGAPYPDGARPSNGCLLPFTSFEKQRAWCSGTAPQTLVNGTAALAAPLPRSAPARTPSSRPTRMGPASPLLIVLLDRTAYGTGRGGEKKPSLGAQRRGAPKPAASVRSTFVDRVATVNRRRGVLRPWSRVRGAGPTTHVALRVRRARGHHSPRSAGHD